jgi:hypothetical protein
MTLDRYADLFDDDLDDLDDRLDARPSTGVLEPPEASPPVGAVGIA